MHSHLPFLQVVFDFIPQSLHVEHSAWLSEVELYNCNLLTQRVVIIFKKNIPPHLKHPRCTCLACFFCVDVLIQ